MRKAKRPLFLLSLLCAILCLFTAECPVAGVEWNGYLQCDNRLRTSGDYDLAWTENRLALQAGASTENTRFYSEFWVRSLGFPSIADSSQLKEAGRVTPVSLSLREAYLDLYGFIWDNLDLRIGRQRIAWGTGDGVNPTDNLNPKDVEDLSDFGRRLGSDSITATWYSGDFTVSGVFIPYFTPAVLPGGEWSSVMTAAVPIPPGITVGEITDVVIMPENNLREGSSYGLKMAKSLAGFDLSVSYIWGRDDLPLPNKITFVNPQFQHSSIVAESAKVELFYPHHKIVGFDFAGAIGAAGLWGEAAVFYPEEVKMLITGLQSVNQPDQEQTILSAAPYIKYVFGMDYTFSENFYCNGQFVHGFPHERGNNLEDYLLLRAEWTTAGGKVKIPVSCCLEIKDFGDLANNHALLLSPELVYYATENTELTLGIQLIEGTPTTTFGKMKDHDTVGFKVKYSF